MSFKNALKTKDFVVTAQLNLSQALDGDTLIRHAEVLRPSVDALQLSDDKWPHISGVAAAALLLQHDVDPIVHMNCRDRNRLALQKDVIGAAALGVTSVLIRRGAKIQKSKKLGIRNVYDTPALEFMTYLQGMKHDEETQVVSDFQIGANAELFNPDPDWTPNNLIRKCDAGANFVQLQMCFDQDVARSYLSRLVASKLTRRANFLMALSPLPSAEVARWVRDNVKGALVPESLIERLQQASDPASEGIAICAELLREFSTIPGVSGANILALGDLASIPVAINDSGVRA